MIDKPEITNTTAQRSAVIRLAVPMSDMPKVVHPALSELMSAVKSQGIGPASAWFIYVHSMDGTKMDFDVGVPVTDPVKPFGRVKASQLPAARVARTIHHGPYEGMPAAWAELDAWIAKNGHKAAGPLWDIYLAGPETGPDSSKWRTQMNRPLV
jgi:effector-binding domain-containing protein